MKLWDCGTTAHCVLCRWHAVAGVIGMSLVLYGGSSVVWLKHTSTFIYITGQALLYLYYTSSIPAPGCLCSL